ncbi:MAG: YwaF family protein, partial [Oscillospiraceae bacterium]|nr:YwaF family protein [Oscillospiraceae bacterium]
YPLALTLRGDMDPQPRAFPRCFALLAAMAVPIWFFNRAFDTNFMFLMRAGEGNPLKLFERFGSHLLGYPVLLAVVFAVMYLLLRVLRRRTAVPAGK